MRTPPPEPDSPFIPLYILMIEDEDGTITLLRSTTGDEKGAMVAREGNQQELCNIGQYMLERGLIAGYQLAKTVRAPIKA